MQSHSLGARWSWSGPVCLLMMIPYTLRKMQRLTIMSRIAVDSAAPEGRSGGGLKVNRDAFHPDFGCCIIVPIAFGVAPAAGQSPGSVRHSNSYDNCVNNEKYQETAS